MASLLGYSQIREYEEHDNKNQIIEAIYKSVANMVKALFVKKR